MRLLSCYNNTSQAKLGNS